MTTIDAPSTYEMAPNRRARDVSTGKPLAMATRHIGSVADFWETDTIMDLDSLDTIDLSRIDADVTAAGEQAFVFVDSFSGAAGEATLRYDPPRYGTITMLDLDINGDSAADIRIELVGDHRAFDNFVL